MMQNLKVDRFGVPDELKQKSIDFFDTIEGYFESVRNFIYTDIAAENDKTYLASRVQITFSQVLLRSIFLNDAAINQLNSGNIIGLYAVLKSLLEVQAVLGHILHILNSKITYDEKIHSMADLHFGARGKGELRVGDRDIKNILSMFDDSIKEIDKIFPHLKKKRDMEGNIGEISKSFYELICNCGHPNYNAHSMLGDYNPNHAYQLTTLRDYRRVKIKDFAVYAPAWNVAITTIGFFSDLIYTHPLIKEFSGIKSKKYFS